MISGSGNGTVNSVGVGNRLPPAYNVAAQRALLHRLGRAHSHEGVTSSISISPAPLGYYQPNTDDTGNILYTVYHHSQHRFTVCLFFIFKKKNT